MQNIFVGHAAMDDRKIFGFVLALLVAASPFLTAAQNRDPNTAEIITEDLDRFWVAWDSAGATVSSNAIEKFYIKPGTKGVKSFMKGRIQSAEHLSAVIRNNARYYKSIKPSTDSISLLKSEIRASLVKLKDIYPEAIFPPVYFVIGALNSGGTSTNAGLIIGAEMYGRTPHTPTEELSKWLAAVIKPVREVPYIVAHELIHFQQTYDGGSLLAASVKEGAADFLGELISGKHINQHVHDFANAKEKELWLEFKSKMNGKDYTGWLYSSVEDRPNDLGYWMGYKITRAYYEKAPNKVKAVNDILHIKNFERFLKASGYGAELDKP